MQELSQVPGILNQINAIQGATDTLEQEATAELNGKKLSCHPVDVGCDKISRTLYQLIPSYIGLALKPSLPLMQILAQLRRTQLPQIPPPPMAVPLTQPPPPRAVRRLALQQ